MGNKCSLDNQDDLKANEEDADNIKILESVEVINTLEKSELRELAKNLEPKYFDKGAYLMTYGEFGTEMFIIVKGSCSVLSEDGVRVATLGPGDYVGEMALLERKKRNATVECLEYTETLVANKPLFDNILGHSSQVKFDKRTAKRNAVITVIKEDIQDEKKENIREGPNTQEEIDWIHSCVANTVLFEGLDISTRKNVIERMYKEKVAQGTILINQGDCDAETFHIIESGRFAIEIDEKEVDRFDKGQCFGELALIHDAPRAATVRALENSVIWTMKRNAFRNVLKYAGKKSHNLLVSWLSKVDLLKTLTWRQLGVISSAFEERNYKKDEVIIKEGDIGDRFYMVKHGEIIWETSSGEHGKRGPGEYFGERALIKNQTRAATITAATESVCLELDKGNFHELLGEVADKMANQIASEDVNSREFLRTVSDLPEEGTDDMKKHKFTDLKTIGILGKGAFGIVSLVVDTTTEESFALKAVKKCEIAKMGFQKYIMNEKDVMMRMNHPFLVNLRGTFKDNLRVYFLIDVCLGGELFTLLRRHKNFSGKESRFFAACVIEAFGYMHSLNIIYRDLKPENLVLDANGYLKVTDFGFAKHIKDETYTLCGTPEYFAPEIVNGQGHGKGVDWWTLGIFIFEMLSSRTPFFANSAMAIYTKIIKGKMTFPRYLSFNSKEIIKGFLKKKPTRRLGILYNGNVQIIRDLPWYNGFDWDKFNRFELPAPFSPKLKDKLDMSNFKKIREKKDKVKAVDLGAEFENFF